MDQPLLPRKAAVVKTIIQKSCRMQPSREKYIGDWWSRALMGRKWSVREVVGVLKIRDQHPVRWMERRVRKVPSNWSK